MPSDKPLTERERRFVEAFMGFAHGNGTEAARMAGYKGTPAVLGVQSTRLLRKASVQAAIHERGSNDPAVSDREDRQRFFTRTMHDDGVSMKDRLKAAELLCKTQGDFVKRIEISNIPAFRLLTE
jgi:phage terminase small subunit